MIQNLCLGRWLWRLALGFFVLLLIALHFLFVYFLPLLFFAHFQPSLFPADLFFSALPLFLQWQRLSHSLAFAALELFLRMIMALRIAGKRLIHNHSECWD